MPDAGNRNRRDIEALAERLERAQRERSEIDRLTAACTDLSVEEAYDIQDLLIACYVRRNDPVVGLKAGLTSKAKQVTMGVHEPIYGQICESMVLEEGQELRVDELIHPRAEPEIAFLLGTDVRGPGVTVEHVLAATEAIVPAIEVIDSRYRNFNFTLPDVVADNASSARVVLGNHRTSPQGIDLRLVGMVFEKNGDVVETGAGAAVLDHPANAVAWLANKLAERGRFLPAGAFVLPGALANAHPIAAGDDLRVTFDRLGSLTLRGI
jgi:2-oxo-3-hexenedioate decarboxylase